MHPGFLVADALLRGLAGRRVVMATNISFRNEVDTSSAGRARSKKWERCRVRARLRRAVIGSQRSDTACEGIPKLETRHHVWKL